MAVKTFKYFDAGIGLKDQAADNITTNGVIYRNGNSLKAYIESALRNIVTDSQTQTLTNKTIDADLNTIVDLTVSNLKAGVLDTDLTAVSALDDTIPSAKATKAYVDAKIATVNDASEITVVPAGTISSTNVQAALEELDGDIQGHINDTTDAHDASAISNIPSGNLAATDVQAALNELQLDIDTRRLTLDNVVLTNAYHLETQASTDNTTTGTNASLATFSAGLVRLTNASLVSLANIPAGANGQILIIFNRTGAAFNIIDSSAATGTAANRIYTGTGATLSMATDSALIFQYDSTSSRWQTVGGSGGGATFSDASFYIFDQADNSKQIKFDAAGTTSTSTTIQSSQTANRILTLPDATDTLTGNSAAQTLTNKTIVAANNTITTASSGNLTSTSLNSALAELQSDIDSNRAQERVFLLDNTEGVGAWTTGDNATFLGGGTLSGTFANETSSPLNGTQSYKYTQAASSLDDYLASPIQSVPLKFRGQQVFLTFPYQYNGNTGDILAIVYDVTNSTIISTTSDVIQGTNGATSNLVVGAVVPSTCSQIRVGFHVKVLNSGKIFSFDDLLIASNLYGNVNVANLVDSVSYTPTISGAGSVTNVSFKYRQVGDWIHIIGAFTTGTTAAALFSITLPNSYLIDSTKVPLSNTTANPGQRIGGYWQPTAGGVGNIITATGSSTSLVYIGNGNTGAAMLTPSNGSTSLANATQTDIDFWVPIVGLSAYNSAVVVPNQQISSDTLAFTFKATAIADADPIGTFNTYTYASGGNTPTIGGTAPTQTAASMNLNGFQLFGRAFNATSTTASPARVDIKVGTGIKSIKAFCYGATGKTTPLVFDLSQFSSTVAGGASVTYLPTTGILSIEAAVNPGTSTTQRDCGYTNSGTLTNSGYFTFSTSTSPSISALPTLQMRVAYLSDVKANGTVGGSATVGFQTRTLNTLNDPTGIVSTLSSNQFSLPAGTYEIEASAPMFAVNKHKARLRNITDSVTSLIGTSNLSNAADNVENRSFIVGQITITAQKTFEIQQYAQTAAATNGLGVETSSGENEIYTIVKIIKIK